MRFFACAAALLAVAVPLSAQQDPVYQLDGLVITGAPQPRSESALGAHLTVLEGSTLRARGLVRLVDALRDVPGLALVEGGSFGSVSSVFLRGGESDFVQVLVDGVQVNEPGGAFDFSGLTLENVERIEVLRGPASALYGSDAVGGVVQVITRAGAGAPTGSLSVRGGSFGRRELVADLRGGNRTVSYGFSVSQSRTDGILAFNNDFENRVLSGVVRFVPDDRSRIDVSTRIGAREFHFPTDGAGEPVDQNAFTYSDDASMGLNVERRVTDRLTVDLALSSFQSDGGTDDAPDGPADTLGFYGFTSLNALQRTEAGLQSHLRFGDVTVGTAGLELSSQTQRAFTESQSEFGPSSGESSNERWNRAAFLHLVSDVGPVALNGGARLEDNQRFGRTETWQLGASWAFGEAGRLRGAIGTGIKEPTFFENYATGFAVGNPDLRPERSSSWEVGAEQSLFGGALDLTATWFDQRFRDLIQYTFSPPAPGDPNYFNVAEASAEGIEAGVVGRQGPLRLSADLTWLRTEVLDAGFDSGEGATFVEGEALLRRPSLIFGGSLGYARASGGRIFAAIRRIGTREDRDFSTFPATPVRLDPYTLVSLGGELPVLRRSGSRPDVTLTVRAENLLDVSYQEVFGFGTPGRGIYVGGRVGLGGS